MALFIFFIFAHSEFFVSLAFFFLVFFFIYTSGMSIRKKYFYLTAYCVIYGAIPAIVKSLGLFHVVKI